MRLLLAFILAAFSASVIASTPTFTSTGTPTFTRTVTATRTTTPTATQTPIVVSYVSSISSSWANSPAIAIAYTPSASGLNELLCVAIGTNNTDDSSIVSSVTFGGVSFTPIVQIPSYQYSEGIEFWALAIGSFPYSMSGNIVITQPNFNTIINNNVTVIEFRGAGQGSGFPYALTISPQAANQSVTVTASLITAFQRSLVLSGYSGVKAVKTFPTSYTNRQYLHKYGTWGSVDTLPAPTPGAYTGQYVMYPPNNPGASVVAIEIPSYGYFTPSPTPTCTSTPTPTVTPGP